MRDGFEYFSYNGGEFSRCTLIPFPHAFSTRSGGVSTLPHLRSMNVASGRGDTEENVAENRRILARAAGCPDERIALFSQVHSADIIYAGCDRLRGDESGPDTGQLSLGELDGAVISEQDITLLVKTADCAPILLCDPEHGVAGALHAGWRGTSAGIALEGVAAALKAGATVGGLRAATGPCIHSCCFETGEDMRDIVISQRGAAFAAEFIREREGRLYADIAGMNLRLLLEAGLKRENIALSSDCTCCRPDRFHSHRATGGIRGTSGAVISLPR